MPADRAFATGGADTRRPPASSTVAFLAGSAAVVIYAAGVIIGGLRNPDYSHLRQTVSELTSPGMPGKTAVDAIFVAYNLCLLLFAASLPQAFRHLRSRLVLTGAALLAATAIAGLLMSTLFPVDPTGAALTTAGRIHIALAAATSLATMGAVAAFGIACWGIGGWRWFTRFSLACLVAILGSGGWAAVSAMGGGAWLGLAERLTIGSFLAWVGVFAVALRPGPRLAS